MREDLDVDEAWGEHRPHRRGAEPGNGPGGPPGAALAGAKPHVIDEWQLAPRIWDTVRHAVDDASGGRGLWILTGSSTPRKVEVNHSGAGRIGRVRMLPMSLFESGDSTGEVSLAALFEGDFERVTSRERLAVWTPRVSLARA